MTLLNDVMKEAFCLVESSPNIATATYKDEIYKTFSNPPDLGKDDVEEGIWMKANQKLDALFGRGHKHILKGPEGTSLVIDWVNKARKHPSWDSPEDKEKKMQKKFAFD